MPIVETAAVAACVFAAPYPPAGADRPPRPAEAG